MASSYDLGLVSFPSGSGSSPTAASIAFSLSAAFPVGSVPLQLGCRKVPVRPFKDGGQHRTWTAAKFHRHSTAETYCDSFQRLSQQIRIGSGITDLRRALAAELVVAESTTAHYAGVAS